jgi:hypothetical protein
MRVTLPYDIGPDLSPKFFHKNYAVWKSAKFLTFMIIFKALASIPQISLLRWDNHWDVSMLSDSQ